MGQSFEFALTHCDGAARRGRMTTAHGVVETPAFMPVGTRGAVKSMTPRDLEDVGAQIILGNTYHLYLRPGDELIARRGGLHRFIGWSGPILTDSGGYQVFSLGDLGRIDEQGVRFRSHLDGSDHLLSPEIAVDIQARLGSDIMMVFDECAKFPVSENEARAAMERTLRWARRGRDRFLAVQAGEVSDLRLTNRLQVQFGIIQGGVFPALREASTAGTLEVGFDAYAIGGLSVGEPPEIMYEVTGVTAARLPTDRPRYLMGSGLPDDLVHSVAQGVDLFDCVLPTRNARNGQVLSRFGPLNLRNARFAEDDRPIDDECTCYTCRHFSRAYLRHLATVGEMTSATLNTLHNLHFYLDTMRRIREAIEFGSFETFKQGFLQTYSRRPLIE
jgi:queuine tRNA-ribosyltransferase